MTFVISIASDYITFVIFVILGYIVTYANNAQGLGLGLYTIGLHHVTYPYYMIFVTFTILDYITFITFVTLDYTIFVIFAV